MSKFKNLTECFVDQYSKYEILKTGGWKKLDKQGDKVGTNVEAVVSVGEKQIVQCLVGFCIIIVSSLFRASKRWGKILPTMEA